MPPEVAATTTATAPPLALREVRFAYEDGPEAVRGVTATLPAGKVCALIGPNAAGKSTLLRLMLGHLSPSSGSVRLAGRDVGALAPARRAALVSYVPQRSGGSFAFTVRQVVELGRHALPPDPAAVDRALACCDLADLEQRVFSHLSVGQQQRVLLARALAQAAGDGQVMLLDEPVSAMDLWHVHQTMRLLADAAAGGLAVLVVVHDLNLASRYADAVWLMDGGRLVAAGHWRQVLTPQVLEPVYRVKLEALVGRGHDRPVFLVEPAAGV